MKHHIKSSLTAIVLLALLGSWSLQAQADTKVRASSFEYDANGLLIKEVIEPDSPNDCLQTSYGYDNYGNKSSVSAAACPGASGYATSSAASARTASSSFGADGRFPVSSSNALGQSETKQYDARFGAPTSLTGPNGLTTQWQYDGFGRKVKETRSDNTYTSWAYKLCGESGANCPGPIAGATSMWVAIEQSYAANAAPSAPEKRAYYDTLNRVVRSQTQGFDGTGAAPTLVQDTEYDSLGRVARKSNLYKLVGGTATWTSYGYDVLGRVTSEQSPDPNAGRGVAVTSMSYNGLVTTVTNSKYQSKTTTKNAQGQVALVTDAHRNSVSYGYDAALVTETQGDSVSYSYDALGQLTQTNAAGSITTMAYNQRGQKVSMIDPAMGAWEYRYNVFGELVWQRDSLGQTVTIAYDSLGRMTQRLEADLTSQWSYDKKFDGSACGKGVGKLCEATADNGYKRVHSYDSLGRPSSTSTVLDNPSAPAVVSVAYDANTGRLASKTWPTGYQASYQYTASGYLKQVTGGGTNGFTQTVAYDVLAMDAQGHITQYKQGNQVTTVKAYSEATGRLSGQTATKDGQGIGNVLNQSYGYDSLGNLLTRSDNSPGVGTQESFSYDSLNRLTLSNLLGGAVSPPTTTEVMYDARGNITYKSDVGRYWYDGVRPNRMTQVTLETAPGATIALSGTRQLTYAFDDYKQGAQNVNGITLGNGNLEYTVSLDSANSRHTYRGESYTSFNMPSAITFGNMSGSTAGPVDRNLAFVYGAEHQRIKQTVTGGPNPGTTWYLNGEDSQGLSYEKEVKANGITENKHYVSAGGLVFALFVQRSGNLGTLPATATRYFHHDHLGSIAAISDENGAVVERLAFDPWGKRRFVNGTPDTLDAIVGQNTDRGYTMHEHLDEMGVIHMNGRVYDPLIGRFMSADPFIQSPDNLQSYNRYAYVLNNPLAYTDPSGYWNLGRSISKAWKSAWHSPIVQTVVTVAIAAYAGPGAAAAYTGARTWHDTGSFSQGLKAAVISYATSEAFDAVGGMKLGAGSPANIAAHAAVGCVSSVASGGSCQSGALSAGFAELATPYVKFDTRAANVAARAVIGGTASVLGGGKFENGAITAAFGYLYNECAHTRACGSDSIKVTVSGNRVAPGLDFAHSEIQISGGYDFVVLEGQPGYSNGNNQLEGRSNGANQGDAFSIELNPLDGRTMAQFAGDLQVAGASYKNNLAYSFPSVRYSFNNLNGGYNSNSYVGGVLDAAAPGAGLRYAVQGAASRRGFRVPGMENPVPLSPVR